MAGLVPSLGARLGAAPIANSKAAIRIRDVKRPRFRRSAVLGGRGESVGENERHAIGLARAPFKKFDDGLDHIT